MGEPNHPKGPGAIGGRHIKSRAALNLRRLWGCGPYGPDDNRLRNFFRNEPYTSPRMALYCASHIQAGLGTSTLNFKTFQTPSHILNFFKCVFGNACWERLDQSNLKPLRLYRIQLASISSQAFRSCSVTFDI